MWLVTSRKSYSRFAAELTIRFDLLDNMGSEPESADPTAHGVNQVPPRKLPGYVLEDADLRDGLLGLHERVRAVDQRLVQGVMPLAVGAAHRLDPLLVHAAGVVLPAQRPHCSCESRPKSSCPLGR